MNYLETESSGQQEYSDCILPGLAIIPQAIVRRMCVEDYCSNWRDNMEKQDGLERFYHSIFDSIENELAESDMGLNSYCRHMDAYLTVFGSLQIISAVCRELELRSEDPDIKTACRAAEEHVKIIIDSQDPNVRKISTYSFRDLSLYRIE